MTKKNTKQKKKKDSEKRDNLDSKIKDFEKEVEKLKNELEEKNNKLLRNVADLQNYQKRMEKEIKSIRDETRRKYLDEILDLYELLLKAYEDKQPKKGLKLLLKNIENFFEKEQIKCIDCVGEKFDHNYHHALSTIEKKDCEDNKIVEEVKKGYTINDKILRPAQVIVAKNKNKNE